MSRLSELRFYGVDFNRRLNVVIFWIIGVYNLPSGDVTAPGAGHPFVDRQIGRRIQR